MLIPEVIGFRLTGALPEGSTATDLVLTVTQMLRKKGVVGKFVEFFGDGLQHLTIEDQATIANMAPEYGATCGFFPVSQATLNYLTETNRAPERVALVEAYAKEQGLWVEADTPEPVFTDTLELDLADVQPSLAGPKRPQDRVLLTDACAAFKEHLATDFGKAGHETARMPVKVEEGQASFDIGHGDVVIAAITSCTNTSNPSCDDGGGSARAQRQCAKGMTVKPWVKTSLAPGSARWSTDYLDAADLQKPDLDKLGFNIVGYGCTTCIGNSGPLAAADFGRRSTKNNLVAAAVLSGNRNFEGRVNRRRPRQLPRLAAARRRLCAGRLDAGRSDARDPLGRGIKQGQPVYLRRHLADLSREVADDPASITSIQSKMFKRQICRRCSTGDAPTGAR